MTTAVLTAGVLGMATVATARPLYGFKPEGNGKAFQIKHLQAVSTGAAKDARSVGIAIERIWAESRTSYAEIRVKNETDRPLDSVVVNCNVLGKQRQHLTANETVVAGGEHAPLQSGADRSIRMVLDAPFPKIHSMKCRAQAI